MYGRVDALCITVNDYCSQIITTYMLLFLKNVNGNMKYNVIIQGGDKVKYSEGLVKDGLAMKSL